MTETSVWITWIAMGMLVFLWMRDKKRLSEKLQDLSLQQSGTHRLLNEFIEETGKIIQEFSRLMPANAPAPAFTSESRRPGFDKRHLVRNLAQKGHPVKEIAERLSLPSGEVELILNLDQSARTKAPA
jgi:hypothetical protein